MDDSWDTLYREIHEHVSNDQMDKAEEVTLSALSLYPTKPEALYLLTSTFREKGMYKKASEYASLWDSSVDSTYNTLFLYEKMILHKKSGCSKQDALTDFISYYNTGLCADYNSLESYVYPFSSHEIRSLYFPHINDFQPTSTSILPYMDGYLLNIRYVNYRIQADSSYLMMENGILSPYHKLCTRNFKCLVSNDFIPNHFEEMIADEPPRHQTNICGIEDIRLYDDGSNIRFIAASCEYSHDGSIKQVRGIYDVNSASLTNIVPLHSPRGHSVEKNWIPTGKTYIYSWHPFVLGSIEGSDFKTVLTYDTPLFFKHVRGSTTLVLHEGYYYAMVHCMIDSRPRKYYHSLVKLDTNYKLQAYTVPLYFQNNHIEYTIGMAIQDDTLICIVSQNDCNPILLKIRLNTLTWLSIQSQTNPP
jgi:hypothetical protein